MDGLEQAPEAQDQLDDQPEQQEEKNEPQSSPDEDKARSGGWRPKEEWVEAGNDADDWKSVKSFNEYGDLITSIKSQKRDLEDSKASFDERLNNQRTFMEAQAKQKLEDLKSQRSSHIENADLDAANATQGQIDDLQAANPPAVDSNNQAKARDTKDIQDWTNNNSWINQPGAKSDFATAEFNRIQASGLYGQVALDKLDANIKSQFPDVNERRNQANRSESPRRANTSKPKSLSMAEVTSDEMKMRNFFTGKDSEKQFLQAVKDARG